MDKGVGVGEKEEGGRIDRFLKNNFKKKAEGGGPKKKLEVKPGNECGGPRKSPSPNG